MSLPGRTAGASATPLLDVSQPLPASSTSSTTVSTTPSSSPITSRSSLSDWFTTRNVLIAVGSVAGVSLLYYGYRRYTAKPAPSIPPTPRSTRPLAPSPVVPPPPQRPAADAASEATAAQLLAPPSRASDTHLSSSTTHASPAVSAAAPTLLPPASPAALVRDATQPNAPSYSPAQAVAALLAETREDVKEDTGIHLDSTNIDMDSIDDQTEQRYYDSKESDRWDEAAEIARRLKEESDMDNKQPVVPYEPWHPPGPLPHKHHHVPVEHVLHHTHHTTTASPLLDTSASASSSVDSQPADTASTSVPVSAAPSAVSEQLPTARIDIAPAAAPVRQPHQSVQPSALAVQQPSTFLVPSPLRTIHPTSILLSSPSLSPIILHPPVHSSTAFVPLPPANTTAALSSFTSLPADTAWLYSASTSAASSLAPSSTSLIPISSSSSAPPSIGSTYYTTLPSYSTLSFNPLHAGNQPILAFITDPTHMLTASTSSPTSTSLTSFTAATASSASQLSTGTTESMGELITRSTLLVELLCVLVLFIGVLATAVDARYLVPLTPITFYVLYVCIQAVRSNGGHTVLFPAALFTALLHQPYNSSSSNSSSSASSEHHLLPRALFPVRGDVALPPSAHLSPVSSAESITSAASPSSARLHSPSSAPSVPYQSSDMDDTPLPPSAVSFSLEAESLSPSAVELSPSSLNKPAQSDNAPHTPVRSGRRREGKEEAEADQDEAEAGYEEKDDEHEQNSMDSPSRGKRVSFLSERRRELVEGTSSVTMYDEEKSELPASLGVNSSRPLSSQPDFLSQSSREHSKTGTHSVKRDATLATDTTDDEELSSAASSTPPSPAQSASSSSSSTPSPIDRELSFFPPEPAIDISGASSSTLTVRFTYRHRWEECVQAFWDISQPDWEQTGHSLGLNTSRPTSLVPPTPSGSSSTAVPPSPSFRRESSAASAVDIEYAIVEWWHSTTSSSLFLRRHLHIHTKVPAVVRKAIGATTLKRLTLDEHAQLDSEARTLRLQCSNARYRKAILIHDTRTFTPHPEHPEEWSVLSCRFRLCVLPSCGLLKGTVYGWVSGVWKGKQQEVGQRIGRRLERWREMRSMEERERVRVEEVGSEGGDGTGEVELGGVSVEMGSERQPSASQMTG